VISSTFFREKLSQYRIEGQSKPFVDKNLQLQLPGYKEEDLVPQFRSFSNPIYSHYAPAPFSDLLNMYKDELATALQEAEQSYKAWKQMQKNVEKLIQMVANKVAK
jgi:hypothetical protein